MSFFTKTFLTEKVKTTTIKEQSMGDIAIMPREHESNSVGPENDFDAGIPMTTDTSSVPAPINVDLMDNPVDQEELLTKVIEPFAGHPYAELGAIVGMLEGMTVLFQTFHWKVNGNSFYGDHLMFQRIYEGIEGQIDGVAEKAIGLGSPNLISSEKITETMEVFLDHVNNMHSLVTDDDNINFLYAKRGKDTIELFIHTVEKMMMDLQDKDLLTKGLDNLLAGILDEQEGFVFLLKQRVLIGA
jgi:DNA-binding ferritin-like protein